MAMGLYTGGLYTGELVDGIVRTLVILWAYTRVGPYTRAGGGAFSRWFTVFIIMQ